MVPAGTKTIAFGPLYGDDGTSFAIIELLFKESTSEFWGYHPDLPMAFKLTTADAKRLLFDPITRVVCNVNGQVKRIIPGVYPQQVVVNAVNQEFFARCAICGTRLTPGGDTELRSSWRCLHWEDRHEEGAGVVTYTSADTDIVEWYQDSPH